MEKKGNSMTNSDKDILIKADKLRDEGRFQEACDLYDQFLKGNENLLALINLGDCKFQLQDYELAKEYLEQADAMLEFQMTKLTPAKEKECRKCLYYNLGQVYMKGFQDAEKATEAFSKAKVYLDEEDVQQMQEIDHLLDQLMNAQFIDPQSAPSSSYLQQMAQVDQGRLKEAQEVAILLSKMEKQVTEGSIWYIVSMKWIEKWQRYVYYDYVDGAPQNQIKEQDRQHPGAINNSDIILIPPKNSFIDDTMKLKVWQNVKLKPSLKEGEDYMIVDEKVWSYVSGIYGIEKDQEIQRHGIMVNEEAEEAIVEVYLKTVLIFPIPNAKSFDFQAPKGIIVSRKEVISDLIKKIQRCLNSYLYFVKQDKSTMVSDVHLWKSFTNQLEEIQTLDKKYKNFTQVKVDAILLNGNERHLKTKIEDANIADDDIIMVELKKKDTFIFVPLQSMESEESKQFDSNSTQDSFQSTQISKLEDFINRDINEVMSSGSKRGVTGLQNLGNTCFMNSGLQCLSNTFELTKYFCFNLHKNDINRENPLGMGGKLALAYAGLIHEMWIGSSGRIAPWDVKNVVGKRVTKFSGFGQQDSCELINYVLDLMHEDLNRIKKKPYVEMKDSDGRPDEEVSKEHWNAFIARNQSIIVDLMYGQLKSTVTCQECNNISITFDPFLTLSLPIARPFRVECFFVPYDMFISSDKGGEGKIAKKEIKVFNVALSKQSKVIDLKEKVVQLIQQQSQEGGQKVEVDPKNTFLINVNVRLGKLMSRFKDNQSCQDIDQSKEDTLMYELRPPPMGDGSVNYKLVELIFMKPVKYNKVWSGEAINKVLPRLEYLPENMTILELKRFILTQTLKPIIKNFDQTFPSDGAINEHVLIQVYDNLPYERTGSYSSKKATCEFCENWHGQADTCDLKIGKVSANSSEGCKEIKILDIYEAMKHKRDLALGIILKPTCGVQFAHLEPSFDTTHIQDAKKKQKEQVSLDSCFQSFSREELLTGADQWYCSKCKEQRDILKKLELYRLPRILIVQLKRFQSKRSGSGQGGFMNLAYAQICSQEKVGDAVDFPIQGLDVRQYIQSTELPPTPIYYDLYAVSNHYGSLHGGHYTAYGFNSLANKWYEFNDSSVSSVGDTREIVSPGAYLLFYRKRE